MKLINHSRFKRKGKEYIVTGIHKDKLINGKIVKLEFREVTDEQTNPIELEGKHLKNLLERLATGEIEQLS